MTTRDVISRLTDETNARPKACGSRVQKSEGAHLNPTNGGICSGSAPISFSCQPNTLATMIATITPHRGAGPRGVTKAAQVATATTKSASTTGMICAFPSLPMTWKNCTSILGSQPPFAGRSASMAGSCEITIMPPIPQEKPATTGWGTRAM